MVKRMLRVVAVICACFGFAWAGELPGAPGRIDAVTVYRSQAAVTRIVPVPAEAGPMELVVTDLPENVVPESIHADGVDGVEIRAVRYREHALKDQPREEVRKLDEQIETLARSLRENKQSQELARKKQAFLGKLSAFSTEAAKEETRKGALETDELSKLTLFVFEQHDTLAKKLLELSELSRKVSNELNLLRRKRSDLTPRAIVFVEKHKDGPAEIRVGYLVRQVGWTPSYNLRFRDGQANVELEYNASIQQMSGEDWTGATLTLSTATPTLSSDPPSLAPLRVILDSAPESKSAHDVVRAERERVVAEEEFRGARTEETRQQAEAAANAASAQKHVLYFRGGPKIEQVVSPSGKERTTPALAVSYPLAGRHSLASRVGLQTIQIAALTLPADFYRLAQPTLTRYVYRQAQLANTSDTVLLQGKVNAYLDGKFAGTGTIPLVRSGQRFMAGFGVDTRLVTRQLLRSRYEKIMGGNKELELTYHILLENFSDEPIAVRVLDRFPVPSEDKILVSFAEAKPKLSADPVYERFQKPRNILRWDVDVPAKATEDKALTIEYQFKLMYPKSLRIHAGRTITPLFELARPLEPWKVELEWSKDQTKLTRQSGKAAGQPAQLSLGLVRGREGKNVIGRRIEGDLTGYRWLVLDLENKIASGARVALGFSTGKEWQYFESMPNYVGPGENPNVVFDLTAPTYKTEKKAWKYNERIQSLDSVRAIYILFYPTASGDINVRAIKLAK